MADRRLPLRHPGHRRADGLGRLARDAPSCSASSAACRVLDLEGLWTRYEDPTAQLAEIAELDPAAATARMQQIYAEPIKPELITERLRQMREAGVTVAGALSPQRTQQHWKTVVDAGVDLFVIRGTTVSAEHVSGRAEPLNLKRFIYELDVPVIVGGAASYTAALHLMRTGAAGVLVGFGGGAAHTTRTAARHPRADGLGRRRRRRGPPRLPRRVGWPLRPRHRRRRRRHLGRHRQGGRVRRRRGHARRGPGPGQPTPRAAATTGVPRRTTPSCPAASASRWARPASLEEILFGPGRLADGTTNLIGALRRAMATTGYSDVKEFQRVEVVVSPYLGQLTPRPGVAKVTDGSLQPRRSLG